MPAGSGEVPQDSQVWQWSFLLVRMYLDATEALPAEVGEVLRQGVDLGRWMQSARLGWDQQDRADARNTGPAAVGRG